MTNTKLKIQNTDLEKKNAELEQFAFKVSHDLDGPLDTIRWALVRLEKEANRGNIERIIDGIQHISHITKDMKQLIREHLELSRMGRVLNPPVECPFGEVARDAVKRMAGTIEMHGIDVEIATDLPVVLADRGRLVEVVQNLVHNAVKYMGEQTRPKVDIGVRQVEKETILYVRDNGMGIDAECHERVFGLFEQLNSQAEGLGIGLAIVKQIVEAHGGRVWVESEGQGHGSMFCFIFPKTKGSHHGPT